MLRRLPEKWNYDREMYLFDTDILSFLMKGTLPEAVQQRLRSVPRERAGTTAITVGELYYGALRSSSATRWLSSIKTVTDHLACLAFDATAARCYGELRAHLEARGQRLDDADLRIAAICVSNDSTLVSANERHFARVPGLKYENWLKG